MDKFKKHFSFPGHCRSFLLALGFLTRMGPAIRASEAEMLRACAYYPLAGAVLGAVLVLPVCLGVFAGKIWIQAWLYVLLAAWLTRALHLDGLADLLDALGSAKTGEGFQAVLKDSRMGAFGCVGLVLALVGHTVFVAACLENALLAPLFYAPLFGRCLPFWLSRIAPAHPCSTLGALLARTPTLPALLPAIAGSAGLACILPASTAFTALLLAGLCLGALRRIALREGGYNGDFCGFAIVCGELGVLFAALL